MAAAVAAALLLLPVPDLLVLVAEKLFASALGLLSAGFVFFSATRCLSLDFDFYWGSSTTASKSEAWNIKSSSGTATAP